MNTKDIRGLHWDGEALHFIDQTRLPFEEVIVVTKDWHEIVAAIKRLAIRGAPAIGVAAGFAALLAFREIKKDCDDWRQALSEIENARPTAVNLAHAVLRMRRVATSDRAETRRTQRTYCSNDYLERALQDEAERIAAEDERMCESIAQAGAEIIPPGSSVLTHCNTGALVTYGIGTALGVIRRAAEAGKIRHVFACEARPLCQGSRLTMWELDKLNIPATLLCDSAAGKLMADRKVDLVIVGADRIARNGDTANKIGTLNLAVLASRYGIPFYVATPSTTFDGMIKEGNGIPIEYRESNEVRWCLNQLITLKEAEVFNPAFDVTPSELITAFIREDGIVYPPYCF